jgi:hypothetical protein
LHYLANAGPILWAELPFKISVQDILWILSTHTGSLGVGKYNAPILHNHKTIGGVAWEIHRLSGYKINLAHEDPGMLPISVSQVVAKLNHNLEPHDLITQALGA